MKYKNKKVGNFRSKLEQFCAKELTTNNIPYEYEAWKVELLPKFTFPNICYEKNSKSSYTEASEKIRSITGKQSNRFNLLPLLLLICER